MNASTTLRPLSGISNEPIGQLQIKIFGAHDTASKTLRERVCMALDTVAMEGSIVEISDPVTIEANEVNALPALMIEGQLTVQGNIPEVPEIARLMKNKDLLNSKLFHLHRISVAVDMSEVSSNALAYAWKIAKETDCTLEIVYAMDSIFEGTVPSASGFLSGYSKTMHAELDGFIKETLGDQYKTANRSNGEPGELNDVATHPALHSKVIYGAPDVALNEYSKKTDLLILGSTGRGGLGKRLFGSVSVEVSRNAHCPVLFVSKDAEFRGFEQMLYACDFDSLNELAVQEAVSFAKRFDAQMHFVHVGPGGEKNLETQREHFEEAFLESGYNKPFIFSKMVSDDIVGAIYEYAFYHRIDLMVFVTHHRAFWDNILHKSVTNEVLSDSKIPILVIHSDDDMA